MNFSGLTASYWKQQFDRVEKVRQAIVNSLSISQGRVIPNQSDIAIGAGRKLKVAILFIDICNFSSRKSENQAEQEMLLAILNLFFSEMIKIAEDYGGTIEKNTGDGLMAYFEDGGSDSVNGAHKAVSCALTMMAANQYLINPILLQSGIDEIKFRISIDYGNVTIAKLGAPRRFNAIVAIGTTANIASKMLSHAGENDILIGADAKAKLPLLWQLQWVVFHKLDTGWVYRANNAPYLFYKYIGRWSQLQ